MIKLFVSDMDGTLLSPNHEITPETLAAIKKLKRQGVQFLVATSRNYQAASSILNRFSLEAEIISGNGAAIYSKDGTLVKHHPLEKTDVDYLSKFFTDHEIVHSAVTNQYYYVSNMDQFHNQLLTTFAGDQPTTTELEHQVDQYMENIRDLHRQPPRADEFFIKFLVFSNDREQLDQLGAQLVKQGYNAAASSPDNIEITHPKADKGQAVREYAKHNHLSLDQVAVIGDSDNDVVMFEVATHSFAMGNANTTVKAATQHTVPTNYEHGVATAIQRVLEYNNRE